MKFKAPIDIDTAICIYHQYPELGNKQIQKLFGKLGNSTIASYKTAVHEKQAEEGVLTA